MDNPKYHGWVFSGKWHSDRYKMYVVLKKPNSQKPNLQKPKSLDLSRRHRCFRCKRFYGRCMCTRRMYSHYISGCMCSMIFKGMLVVLVIYLISKVMNSYESTKSNKIYSLESK